ncbi:hypothetical protein [Haloferula sp. BvORR071]|uniref:hypothetical protein n=1 Tax=Haloferula sp. BvORR071 TaxID=1396141 RepID=UPI000553040B|nr:hypothetical protein [Haloferula sp. BvORR071]
MTIEEAEGYIALNLFQDAWVALDALPELQQTGSEVLRLRILCMIGLRAWSQGEAIALMLAQGNEQDREIAAAFFHEGAVWHAAHTGLALARHWISAAIEARPEQRILMLQDHRFPEGLVRG